MRTTDDLFADTSADVCTSHATGAKRATGGTVGQAAIPAEVAALAEKLWPNIRLGTSSWSFPGWEGLVWERAHSPSTLAKYGLEAYARHPLLRTVSLDRAFYRPLEVAQYAAYAAQVPADFRFLVKAPSVVTDAVLRDAKGRRESPNESFLNAALAESAFILPALEGLGEKLGALVFQISPLPLAFIRSDVAIASFMDRIASMLADVDVPALASRGVTVALEVRDSELVRPGLASMLRSAGATYCLGVHPRLPPVAEQAPLLRALWPGPFVCRWNLNALHGPHGYDEAREHYRPFNRLVDPDPGTREAIARIVAGTAGAGFATYVTVNNKAEGSAPLSVQALARAVASVLGPPQSGMATPAIAATADERSIPARTAPSVP